ncbi:hypothetical protein CupriaWKF_18520 [Cupriavidus sp. WKF15]|uniref:hypothetical protein n=1 Tax=Cupriavidus sp. WKF15 TaxID=3032282 RepID=UPI0023E0ED98|nr:hypothetical protein [Cupriavidus sp. WKF15]WER49164.1 hypothetical protein CupriaWKF_18520 [Cupriavidus sp. WKF15]
MDGRRFYKIALAFVAGAAMAAGGQTLAAGRGGGGGGMHGGMRGGMRGGSFHGHDGFHHDGFHHGHGHAFFVVGAGWPGWWGYPYYGGWPYPDYYGYYAPPAQYIEKGDVSDGASANAWWYRCDQPSGYYPYVKTCPGGWQTVPAQPSS